MTWLNTVVLVLISVEVVGQASGFSNRIPMRFHFQKRFCSMAARAQKLQIPGSSLFSVEAGPAGCVHRVVFVPLRLNAVKFNVFWASTTSAKVTKLHAQPNSSNPSPTLLPLSHAKRSSQMCPPCSSKFVANLKRQQTPLAKSVSKSSAVCSTGSGLRSRCAC